MCFTSSAHPRSSNEYNNHILRFTRFEFAKTSSEMYEIENTLDDL